MSELVLKEVEVEIALAETHRTFKKEISIVVRDKESAQAFLDFFGINEPLFDEAGEVRLRLALKNEAASIEQLVSSEKIKMYTEWGTVTVIRNPIS